MKAKVHIGDVVLVPASGGFIPAKVLYVSKRFKNVILLGMFAALTVEKKLPLKLPSQFSALLYTSQEPISKGRWSVVGIMPLSDDDRALSKRIVAGDVWLDDEMLGVASDSDLRELPKMLVVGATLVEKRASALVSSMAI